MNILVDISHPAHIHFFKHAIRLWQAHDHQIKIVARDKDITLRLLDDYKYSYQSLSKARKGLLGLSIELIEHEFKIIQIAGKFRPDVMLNIGGTFIVHAGKLLGIKTVVFTDTEHAKLSNNITFPFATYICTPSCYIGNLGKKQVRYNGYHELAYLHPNRFSPNPAILDEIGVKHHEAFFLVRFINWNAAHDVGLSGFSIDAKRELVEKLNKLGRIFITSEVLLPDYFEPYRFTVSPTKIHDLLYYSSLYIGEGATMASEAAILGVPSIYVNPLSSGNLEEEEMKYEILRSVQDEKKAIQLAVKFASDPLSRSEQRQKSGRLLADKIDVTAWMVDFVENCC
jgi:predicted glycosyltransferase